MVPDWKANTVLISDMLPSRHPEIVRQLEGILQEHGIPLVIVPDTADIWTRDAAPVQVSDGEFAQFVYRPDYLRDGYEHLITGPEAFNGFPFINGLERSELVIDGGNIVGVPGTAILTDKVFRENPDRSRSEIEEELRRLLRAERLIFIPKEPYDSIGHVDGMVRFINDTTLVMNDYSTVDPNFGNRLRASLERRRLEIELLPYQPERRRFDGIESAAGNYVNYLRVGNLIIVPSYGLPEDVEAIRILNRLCPEATVVPVPCLNLAREGGVLQCVTWTVRVVEPKD